MRKGLILLLMFVLPLLLVACSEGEAVPPVNNNEDDTLHKNITGVYGGQTDENAVVIIIDEGISFPSNINPVTFELSREIKECGIIPALVTGDRVSFDCSFASGMWEIKRIAKLEAARQTVSAVFGGWIDNNMFEAIVGGQPTPFWVAEEIKPEVEEKAPEPGAEMELTYYEDGYGRLVLTEVKFE
ncbi:Uncharacterized [Moorella glycerini]|uniref:Uncharacterized protein n=1 Tax=Neomoorella stamsii TaxID=1266720 RepID=A0A9X7P650_9FIRM|nr:MULTISPECIES: hypothetical protein [Moorella]PRR72752.1 hypothetical protein MOST_16460 [Moorella stamsii]CEP68097.1 Uncharacterized [Moorella glycerini]